MPPTRIGIGCWQFGLPCFPLDQRSTKVCISPLAVRDDQQGWPIFSICCSSFHRMVWMVWRLQPKKKITYLILAGINLAF